MYRACAARANFLSQDRPDIQYSVKEICRGMSNPTTEDLIKLKRLARYLKGCPRAVFTWHFQSAQEVLNVYSDSDWAGCKRTRKSTQGYTVMYGNHCIKSHSSTQATIALSSAEAEYYALVKAASIALGMRAMYRDLGLEIKLNLFTDATGAKGIATRRGLGKLRHVDVHLLWLQQQVASGIFKVYKVDGKQNPADLYTKYLSQDDMKKHMKRVHFWYAEGRAAVCPQVSQGV